MADASAKELGRAETQGRQRRNRSQGAEKAIDHRSRFGSAVLVPLPHHRSLGHVNRCRRLLLGSHHQGLRLQPQADRPAQHPVRRRCDSQHAERCVPRRKRLSTLAGNDHRCLNQHHRCLSVVLLTGKYEDYAPRRCLSCQCGPCRLHPSPLSHQRKLPRIYQKGLLHPIFYRQESKC